ncbi:hypothetical protein [Bradyrhizobium sp. 930_D9_N1_4]|uniref:hypothetical protein n=1 Tax=Bradyrhizobium sp. 930_D9_N1_4 TaxID=3240374 RepID=UPI003F899392
MSAPINVAVDDKLASVIWRTYGLAQAFEALGGDRPKSTLPGFAFALALVEKEMADQRAAMSGAVYKAAARAGHDINNVASILTDIKNGKPCIQIVPADLVDQAEAST